MAGKAGALQARLQAPPDWRRQRRLTFESHSRASSGDPAFHQWPAGSRNLATGVLCGIRWAALQARAGRSDGRVERPATIAAPLWLPAHWPAALRAISNQFPTRLQTGVRLRWSEPFLEYESLPCPKRFARPAPAPDRLPPSEAPGCSGWLS